MRAVNLIPQDLRRGSSSIGRSGGAVYVVLGALGFLMILAAVYAVANHQVADRKAKLVQATRDSAAAQARAQQLAPYQQFAALKNQREQAIVSLAAGRFDWPAQMRNVAVAMPADVKLNTFDAGLGQSGGTGASATPTSAAGGAGTPNVHLTGCATSHTEVGSVIDRMRGIPGVASVTFASSSKGGGSSSGASTQPGTCTGPQFDITVFFAMPGAGSPAAAGSPQAVSAGTPSSAAKPSPAATSAPAPAAAPTPSGAHP